MSVAAVTRGNVRFSPVGALSDIFRARLRRPLIVRLLANGAGLLRMAAVAATAISVAAAVKCFEHCRDEARVQPPCVGADGFYQPSTRLQREVGDERTGTGQAMERANAGGALMRTAIAIAVAGAAGALSRYGLQVLVSRKTHGEFPWGTFVVNISGAFAVGLIFTLTTERWALAPWLRSALIVGFLGAYTTFSTLSFETYRLAADRALGLAFANVAGSCAAGLAAVYLGVILGRLI